MHSLDLLVRRPSRGKRDRDNPVVSAIQRRALPAEKRILVVAGRPQEDTMTGSDALVPAREERVNVFNKGSFIVTS